MLKNMILSLLSRFYAKSESDLVSQQALPNYAQNIQIDLPLNEDPLDSIEYELVAPENGYICLLDREGSPRGHSLIMCNGFTNGTHHPNLPIDSYVTFAVKKGQTYTIRYCGSGAFVRFVRTIGGGKKVIRGGSVCLKNLLHFCSKNSSSRTEGISPINHSPDRRRSITHPTLFVGSGCPLLPRMMGFSRLLARTLSRVNCRLYHLTRCQVQDRGVKHLFHVEKAKPSGTSLVKMILAVVRETPLFLSNCWGLSQAENTFSIGGESC